eukprot:2041704-Alexandrium_andersonii.AAC.2
MQSGDGVPRTKAGAQRGVEGYFGLFFLGCVALTCPRIPVCGPGICFPVAHSDRDWKAAETWGGGTPAQFGTGEEAVAGDAFFLLSLIHI